MAELLTVQAARTDGRVVLWERHAEHPGGEVFIAGNGAAVPVARTAAVLGKLRAGELIEVKAAAQAEVKAEAKVKVKAKE